MNDRFRYRIPVYKNNEFDGYVYICLGDKIPDLHGGRYGMAEQCTKLRDKNGKLIYEGDWLKTKDGYYCYVVWYDGFWWVKSLPSEAMDLEHSEFYKDCEVIGNIHVGNIYENPELLENRDERAYYTRSRRCVGIQNR